MILTHPFARRGSASKRATFNKLIHRVNRITFIEHARDVKGGFYSPDVILIVSTG